MTGKGRNIRTPIKLNNRWAIATAMASSDLNSAAIMAVMVVPTLAPRMKLKAFCTEILRVAAKGTIREVVIELDWIPAVRRVPQPKALRGLLKTIFSKLTFD